ncbi:MAG: adenylate/guanylate cyclase domain-containing protein [Planctomycetaceae bacterium]|nr:adenylate/guanylate cyclase domain-containing protein [Planctomycetaceae bacterium]
MSGTPEANAANDTSGLDFEQILLIDAQLDNYLDANRANSMAELAQGAIDLIQTHTGGQSIWIQFAGPRTFDGENHLQTLLFSTETDTAITNEVEELVEAYRIGNLSSNHSIFEWEPMNIRSGEHLIIATPMFQVQPEVYIGMLGMVLDRKPQAQDTQLIEQCASRLDTYIKNKNLATEHHTVIALSNSLLDQEGTDGIGETLLLLQKLVRAPKAAIVYLNDPYDHDTPPQERRVNALFAADGKLIPPSEKNAVLHEGLGGNLIEYDGSLEDSAKAMSALGAIESRGAEPLPFVCMDLKNRVRQPHINIGKLVLIGSPPISQSGRDVMQSIGMQLDTKIVNYHRTKRHLRRSLSDDQVEFFVRRPAIADWFFKNPRNEEIGMVFADICGYTDITREIGDPVETIRVAKNWILRQIELTAQHSGYFDKDIGDCAVSLFGPPFFELSIDTLLNAADTDALESMVVENPSDPARYAYQAVSYALETVEAIKDFRMHDHDLQVSIGVEVGQVAIGDLNGRLGALTAMGDAMNLSARLQGLAQRDEIVIGPNCHKRLEEYRRNNLAPKLPFTVTPAGEANLKGYDKPVQYYLVTASET